MTMSSRNRNKLLLASVESFCGDAADKNHGQLPNRISLVSTMGAVFLFLLLVEHTLRQVLTSFQHLHPLLENETNRNILARHVGVDAVGCFFVAYLGWKARHVLWKQVVNNQTLEFVKAYDNRLFQYHPEAARVMTVFIGFQCKNLIDTLVWKDGPEFVAHHILAIYSTAGGLIPGACHFYAIFYMGLSEFSTGILCLLVNFDNDHGVPGLDVEFPNVKIAFGVLFAICFVLIRVVFWSKLTYHYFVDVRQAYRDNHAKLIPSRRIFFFFNNLSLGFITVLQIVWLFEIGRVTKMELKNMGIL